MTDIVQQLRHVGIPLVSDWDEMRKEAADEIERLRLALNEILSLQPLKTQHEHYIAMLKTLEIVRKALR